MQKLPKISPVTLKRLAEPFDDPDWVFELKHDGFRGLAYIEAGECKLISRNANVFRCFPQLCESLSKLPVRNAILDGEIICMDGVSAATPIGARLGACEILDGKMQLD
jgi:bifunctional non-homologous end joining protein LigD